MDLALYGLGAAFFLLGLVCHVMIAVHAFKAGLIRGLLTLFVGCFTLYWAFVRFEHPRKGLIVAGWIVGSIGCGIVARMLGFENVEAAYGAAPLG